MQRTICSAIHHYNRASAATLETSDQGGFGNNTKESRTGHLTKDSRSLQKRTRKSFGAKEWWEWPNLRQWDLMVKRWIGKCERVQFCLFSTAVSPGAMSSCLLTRITVDYFFCISPLQNFHISDAKSVEPTHWCNQEDVGKQPKDKIRWDDMSKINWISQWQSTLIVLRSCASPCSSPYHLSALLFHFSLLYPFSTGVWVIFLPLWKPTGAIPFVFAKLSPGVSLFFNKPAQRMRRCR